MYPRAVPIIAQNFARCRLILSVVALVAVYVDPTQPIVTRWISLTSGSFMIDPLALTIMGMHLCYSVLILALPGAVVSSPLTLLLTTWCDVFFGAAIAVVTEGGASPFFTFFAFAVMEAGLTAGFQRAMLVTLVSVALYLSLIVVSAAGNNNVYITRPIYIAITGYLVGYFGQQRLNLEAGMRELAVAAEREQIARDLHDVRAQVLAGISLGLVSCQELLRRQRYTEALLDLSDLQASVDREHDDLRAYMRSLISGDLTQVRNRTSVATRFSVRAQFDGSGALVDHVLQILREGVTNVMRHSHAGAAALHVEDAGRELRIRIDDDGVGFRNPEQQPWSIASRVSELGGTMQRVQEDMPGAHLAITLPVQ
jgi:signal transduction histidine kinase